MSKIITIFLFLLAIILSLLYFYYQSNFTYYWHDEVLNLLALSGYDQESLMQKLYDGTIKTQADLLQFQNVNDSRNLGDTINCLIKTPNYELPLYYVILWTWTKLFGSSDWALKSLSIIIWLFCLLCVYYLSLSLFEQKSIALLSTILFWLSPRFINYAIEVWEYGLYILLTALSSALFLKAFNSLSPSKNWLLYSFSLIAGLYTHVFFIFVALAHFIYFLWNQHLTNLYNRKFYFYSFIGSLLLYYPWLQLGINHQISIYRWSKGRANFDSFIVRWFNSIPGIFYALDSINRFVIVLNTILVIGVFLSVVYLIKTSKREIWSFLILLTTVPFLGLVITDLLFTTRYSLVGRFYLPTFLGILLIVSFTLGKGMVADRKILRIGSYICLGILLWLGLVSKMPTTQTVKAYKGHGSNVINTSFIINQSSDPLIISDDWLNVLTLSHKTKNTTDYLLVKNLDDIPKINKLQKDYSSLYLLNPSKPLKKELISAGIKIEKTDNQALWQIK